MSTRSLERHDTIKFCRLRARWYRDIKTRTIHSFSFRVLCRALFRFYYTWKCSGEQVSHFAQWIQFFLVTVHFRHCVNWLWTDDHRQVCTMYEGGPRNSCVSKTYSISPSKYPQCDAIHLSQRFSHSGNISWSHLLSTCLEPPVFWFFFPPFSIFFFPPRCRIPPPGIWGTKSHRKERVLANTVEVKRSSQLFQLKKKMCRCTFEFWETFPFINTILLFNSWEKNGILFNTKHII